MSRKSNTKSLKRWLFAALAVGLLALSGNGTFASFNAQTTNKTSSLASGTLTLSDQVNSGTVCLSANAPTDDNKNKTCAAVLAVSNIEPGSWDPLLQSATVTIENTGSLNASLFTLQAPTSSTATPNCHGTYTSSAPASVTLSGVKLTNGSTSITDTTGFGAVTPGMTIYGTSIPYSTTTPTTVVAVYGKSLVMSRAATSTVAGGESVQFYSSVAIASVTSTNASPSLTVTAGGFPRVTVGMTVTGTTIPTYTVVTKIVGNTVTMSQNATGGETQTVTFGASYGKQLNFASNPSTLPICASAVFYVQESAKVGTTTDYYCWYGYGSTGNGTPQATNHGLCTAPLSTTLTASLGCTTGTFTMHVTSLTGPVFTNDVLTVTSGGKTCQYKAKTGPYAPTTSTKTIKVSFSSSTNRVSYPAGSTVVDTTSANHLNSTATYTLKNFDTLHGTSGPIKLYPISGTGAVNKTAPVRLGALSSRTFTVGLYLPEPNASVQNDLQGLKTFFSLKWYIQQ